MKPTDIQQSEALIAAISEILWNIGEKVKVVITLTGDTNLIPHSHTYFQDSVTEKVILFQKKKKLLIEFDIGIYLFEIHGQELAENWLKVAGKMNLN